MRVFVTGASGFIGAAVIPELKKAGHSVVGLARSDKSAEKLRALGVEAIHGQIEDTDLLAKTAKGADGVIHLAFFHDDLTKFAESSKVEHGAILALGGALEGSSKPLIVASGVIGLTQGRPSTEDDGLLGGTGDTAHISPRQAGMTAAMEFAKKGVRAALVRLSPVTHGPDDVHGFAPTLIKAARTHGYAAYVGDGSNRWPACHRFDAAKLFALALEKAKAGTALHAVGEEGVPVKSIAEAIGKKLGVPVKSITAAEGPAYAGFVGMLLGVDGTASNAKTRASMGWEPTHAGLIADLESDAYAKYFA